MSVDRDLILEFDGGQSVARPLRQWRGFSAEHVVVGADSYAFERTGSCHYLALHDIVVSDGEVAVDGLATSHAKDWRGSVAFIPKGCSTHGWVEPSSRRNSFTALYFEPGLVSEELERRYDRNALDPFLFVRPPPLVTGLGRLKALLLAPDADDLLAESVCLVASLEVFGIQADPSGVGLSARHLKLVNDFIDDRLGTRISVSDLSQLCGLTRFHFMRAFKKATGLSPYAYVTAKRIDRAREFLKARELTVEEIATLVGFPTSAQFRKAFRTRVGCSASQYRARGSEY